MVGLVGGLSLGGTLGLNVLLDSDSGTGLRSRLGIGSGRGVLNPPLVCGVCSGFGFTFGLVFWPVGGFWLSLGVWFILGIFWLGLGF